MLLKTRNDGKGYKLFKYIMFAVTMCIIAYIIMPRFSSTCSSLKSPAEGIAGALSGTIARKHKEFLLQGIPYNASSVIAETTFANGLAVPTVDGDTITWVSGSYTFTWTYTANNGDASAYLTEDNSSAFGIREP